MGRKVLILDQSLYSRMILKDMLGSLGYSVSEASNPAQAVEKYEKSRPDVVMVDANLREMDGAKAIEMLRRHDPSLIAVICAATGQRGIISQAFSAGAIAHCPKPFKEKSIKDAFRNLSRQPVWN